MRILVTGSSGLVGSSLVAELIKARYDVVRLIRTREQVGAQYVFWNPQTSEIDSASLEGIDAVVHLAGENIVRKRWTTSVKQHISNSRIKGTSLLCNVLSSLARPPQVLISASAIGYYGDRGDEILSEDSSAGDGFLAQVCREWEAATQPAADKGIRVVTLRIGMVLSPKGGALARLLPLFRFGLGGKMGNGNQYTSWVSIDDLIGIIKFALRCSAISGPVNAVAPNPVTNLEFTRTLGRVLRRPAAWRVPALALRLAVGDMADEMLLASIRARPARLIEHGCEFVHPDLAQALRALLTCS